MITQTPGQLEKYTQAYEILYALKRDERELTESMRDYNPNQDGGEQGLNFLRQREEMVRKINTAEQTLKQAYKNMFPQNKQPDITPILISSHVKFN